jgi:hypothetical protein
MNKLMIQLSFVDLILASLAKLRFFNGYMNDDVTLTTFCKLTKVNACHMKHDVIMRTTFCNFLNFNGEIHERRRNGADHLL